MYRARYKVHFDMAHHHSRDDEFHGHGFTAEVFVASRCLDSECRALNEDVTDAVAAIAIIWHQRCAMSSGKSMDLGMGPQNAVIFPGIPTADVLAKTMFDRIKKVIEELKPSNKMILEKVRVHEGDMYWAEYSDLKYPHDGKTAETPRHPATV